MDPCGGKTWAHSRIITVVGNGSLTDKIVNTGTSWSSTNLQVYTRASSCAWTRQSTPHSRFGTLQLYMNCGSHYIVLLRLFRVDWNPIIPFQHQTGERESLHTDKMSGKNSRAGWLPKPSLGLPFAPFTIKMAILIKINILFNKMLFFSLVSWWLHLSVFKFTFEACFACSAQYF